MPSNIPYPIDELRDEASRLRPVVRLTHLLLRTCLEGGFTELRLRAATGEAEVKQAGAWTPIMKFPTVVYDALVDQVRVVAGADQDLVVGDVTPMRLRWNGRDVAGTMTAVGTSAGVEAIEFEFELPLSPDA